MANDALTPRKQNSEAALAECVELEAEIAGLRAAYEQYFSGVERLAPLKRHEALKKRLNKLKTGFVKQTAVKFRVNTLYAKYLTYERQWTKTLEQRENGTYRPDLERARRRAKQLAEQEQRKKGGSTGAAMRGVVELDPTEDVDLDDFDFEDAPSAPATPARAAPPSDDEFDALLDALSEAPVPTAKVPTPAVPRQSVTGVPPGSLSPVAPGALTAKVALTPRGGTTTSSPAPSSGARPASGSAVPVARQAPGAEGPVGAVAARPSSGAAIPAVAKPAPGAGPTAARPVSGSVPAVARPAQPPAQAPRTPTGGAVSDQKLKAVYDAYVMAKRRCNEDTSQLSFEKVAGELRREVGQLTREGGARSVEFKVVIKDGQAQLRTVPKD